MNVTNPALRLVPNLSVDSETVSVWSIRCRDKELAKVARVLSYEEDVFS